MYLFVYGILLTVKEHMAEMYGRGIVASGFFLALTAAFLPLFAINGLIAAKTHNRFLLLVVRESVGRI